MCVGGIAAALAGCQTHPYPSERLTAVEVHEEVYQPVDRPKPLPPPDVDTRSVGPAPFADAPIVVDFPPEARAFVDTYNKVNKPRILILVNRTLDGQIVPTQGDAGPERVTEREHRSAASTDDKPGPNDYHERTTTFLKPGEYDEMRAKSIDYGLMEILLSDWMSADNQITLVSPTFARKKLTDAEIKDLQEGRPQAMSELARQVDADILIQVQARPTRQTREGLELRVLAEAVNIKGGESLARAAVDVYPPLDKRQLNRYTRYLASKLMDGMTQSWTLGGRQRPAAPPADKGVAPH
jgi:hypothetical protein